MEVVFMPAAEWNKHSEQAHLIVFNEVRPADMNRIDFALVAEDEGVPQLYMTCREVDAETVYIQYGGAFPSSKNSPKSFAGYLAMVQWLSKKYKMATMLVENSNVPMLKFALASGFRCIGIRNFKGIILLEHFIDWTKHE